jgi:TP901 family phage tail tape measure protein
MATQAGAIRAGGAYVELFTEDGKFNKGLTAAQNRLRKFGEFATKAGGALLAAGAAAGGPLLAMAKTFADAGDELNKMAIRTRISVEELSKLKFAAEQSGTSIETLSGAIFRMNRRIANAATESGPARRALDELGIDAKEFARLDPQEQFLKLADALKSLGDEGLATQLGFELFGGEVKALLPLILEGSAGIEELTREAEKLGLVMSDEDAQAAADFGDALNRLTSSAKAMSQQIGAAVVPALTELLDKLQPTISDFVAWIKENREAAVTLGKIAGTAVLVGGGLVALGQAINAVTIAIGAMTAAAKLSVVHMKAIAAVGLAAALTAIARAAYHASEGVQSLNRELEKSERLNQRLSKIDRQRLDETLAQAEQIDDRAEKKRFLQNEIEKLEKNLQGQTSAVTAAERELDRRTDRNFVQGASAFLFGDAEADLAKDNLRTIQDQADATRAQIDRLKQAMEEAPDDATPEPEARRPRTPLTDPRPDNPLARLFTRADKLAKGQDPGLTAGEMDQAVQGFQALPDLMKRVVAGAKQAEEEVVTSTHRIQQTQAVEAGSAEAQRAIAEALAPRVTVETRIQKATEQTQTNTAETADTMRQMLDVFRRTPPVRIGDS